MKINELLNKLCIFWQKNTGKMLIVCYVVVCCLSLSVNVFTGAVKWFGHKNGTYEEKHLNLNDFEHFGVEQLDDMTMINASDDTQLWYTGNMHNLYVKCDFSYAPGEYIVFYNKTGDGVFGIHQMVHAYEVDGWYIFQLPAGTKQIRMDTGIYPSITIEFEEIILNRCSFNDMMRFSTSQLLWTLVLPAIVFCALDTGVAILQKMFGKSAERAEKETQKV